VTPRLRWLAAAVLLLVVAVGGWFGWRAWQGGDAAPAAAMQELPEEGQGAETVETVQVDQPAIVTVGTTPMRERVAVLGLLNKRNGRARDVTLKPGQGMEIGDVRLHLRACERTAPWENDQLTGAFVQVDVRGADRTWRRPFSGWLYKERPNLNVVQHPIYDVWTKSCTMSFPATGPDTERLTPAAPVRSRAVQSPGNVAAPVDTPTTPANAADSAPR
jgi:hypothetical protein